MDHQKPTAYIAFYGTLMEGEPAYEKLGLQNHLTYVGPCEIKGRLYDIIDTLPGRVPNYPACVEGDGFVKAQLFNIRDDSFFDAMDGYECAGAEGDPNALYVRKPLELRTPANVTSWVYVYNQGIEGREEILSGDWKAHLAEKKAALDAKPAVSAPAVQQYKRKA